MSRPPSALRGPSVVSRPSPGFSLIEVIIAVALFAASVTVILALLPGLTRRGAENSDRLVAQRLPDAVRTELTRLALPGFDALAAQTPLMGTPPASGLALVATRDGVRLHSRDFQTPAAGRIAEGGQYFLVECWRFPSGPLAYDAAQSSLTFCVRVSWPYRQPGADAPVPDAARQEFMFVTSLNR
jgi:prepilin-type N-terminal cleavage/methylation domain-containing protein